MPVTTARVRLRELHIMERVAGGGGTRGLLLRVPPACPRGKCTQGSLLCVTPACLQMRSQARMLAFFLMGVFGISGHIRRGDGVVSPVFFAGRKRALFPRFSHPPGGPVSAWPALAQQSRSAAVQAAAQPAYTTRTFGENAHFRIGTHKYKTKYTLVTNFQSGVFGRFLMQFLKLFSRSENGPLLPFISGVIPFFSSNRRGPCSPLLN